MLPGAIRQVGRSRALAAVRRRVSSDDLSRETSEGEGACLWLLADRSHLPLRGKLGWMTPRAGVKTTPAIETRLQGAPDPKRGPHFLSLFLRSTSPVTCLAQRHSHWRRA